MNRELSDWCGDVKKQTKAKKAKSKITEEQLDQAVEGIVEALFFALIFLCAKIYADNFSPWAFAGICLSIACLIDLFIGKICDAIRGK